MLIIHAGENIMILLTKLFNMCLLHDYVPESFGSLIIAPIVKDKSNNLGEYDN